MNFARFNKMKQWGYKYISVIIITIFIRNNLLSINLHHDKLK